MGKKKAVAIREQIRTAFTAAGVDPILVLDAEIRTAKDKRKVSPAELASLAAVRDALAHVVESKPSRPVRRARKAGEGKRHEASHAAGLSYRDCAREPGRLPGLLFSTASMTSSPTAGKVPSRGPKN